MGAEYSLEEMVLTYTTAVCGKLEEPNMKPHRLKKPL
jgi:hypothetical protein